MRARPVIADKICKNEINPSDTRFQIKVTPAETPALRFQARFRAETMKTDPAKGLAADANFQFNERVIANADAQG